MGGVFLSCSVSPGYSHRTCLTWWNLEDISLIYVVDLNHFFLNPGRWTRWQEEKGTGVGSTPLPPISKQYFENFNIGHEFRTVMYDKALISTGEYYLNHCDKNQCIWPFVFVHQYIWPFVFVHVGHLIKSFKYNWSSSFLRHDHYILNQLSHQHLSRKIIHLF